MASISSTGVGSGIDIGALVSSLVSAEGAAKSARIDRREAEYTAKLSSLSALKGAVSDFQSSYSSLRSVSTFNALTASSSDTDVFTVSAEKAAASGSYDIDVTQLAVAQKLQTGTGYADSNSTSIGTGTLTFAFASDLATTFDVTITDGTLQGIRNAINDADIGVNANIVFDGADYQMVLTSQTGTDNELTIIQTSTTGDLSAFEYDSTVPAGNLTQSVASADAIFTVDGVGITSASNTITNVISDVTLELVGTGVSEKLSISQNTSSIGTAVQGFVDGYNSLVTTLNEASAYSETGASGILIGDSTVRGIVSQLRSILNTTVGDSNTKYNSLASIGILTARDGTLEYDSSKLTTAISTNVEEVQQLLAGGKATASDSNVSITSISDDIAAGSYAVDITQAYAIGVDDVIGTIGGLTADTTNNFILTGQGTYSGFVLDLSSAAVGSSTITVSDGLMDNLDTLISNFLDSDGIIDAKTNGLTSSIADITEQRAALNERLATYEARLLKQFNAMDTIVAQLNVTSNFLTNQLDSLSGLANRPNK